MTTNLYFIGGDHGFKPHGQKFVVLLNEKNILWHCNCFMFGH